MLLKLMFIIVTWIILLGNNENNVILLSLQNNVVNANSLDRNEL